MLFHLMLRTRFHHSTLAIAFVLYHRLNLNFVMEIILNFKDQYTAYKYNLVGGLPPNRNHGVRSPFTLSNILQPA